MSKPPTAISFMRDQGKFAEWMLKRTRERIDRIERGEEGAPEDLEDLYEDEVFFERYADAMSEQREYFRRKYLEG